MCDKEQTDIQIVPVSIFWGRNPGKTETSLSFNPRSSPRLKTPVHEAFFTINRSKEI